MKVLTWNKLLGNSPQIKKKGLNIFLVELDCKKWNFQQCPCIIIEVIKGYRCEFVKKMFGAFVQNWDSFLKKNLSISSASFDSLATFDCVGARAADI